MVRNIGKKILMALGAAGVIAAGLAAGILLLLAGMSLAGIIFG